MARGATKKGTKASSSSQPTKPTNETTDTSPKTLTAIPEPFTPVPDSLRPFVATLPTSHVYAVHIDHNPPALKRRVYMVPVAMNLAIAALLAWRIYYAAPIYLDQLITIFGYETAWKVNPSQMGVGSIAGELMDRTFLLMFDYVLFAFVGSWPWEFVFGNKYNRHTGALAWRREVGFQASEVVVRKGRKWDTPLLQITGDRQQRKWTVEDELTLKFKVEPAMRTAYTSKTGYLLLDKEWDLDFKGMIDAHALLAQGKLKPRDLDHIALVHYERQWLVWNVRQTGAEVSASSTAASATRGDRSAEAAAAIADEDVTLQSFRDKLLALGQEEAFFRWIEIVQYETSVPGGFTPGKQAEAMRELRRLLTERGVNFAQFWDDIGGQSGVPGLHQVG